MPGDILKKKLAQSVGGRPTGSFPYEQLDFRRTEDMLWLKNSAIDTSITGIVFADLEGRIFYANEAAVRMWRCTDPSDYINQSAGKFSQSREKSLEVFQAVIAKGVWADEIGGVRKDGTSNHVYLQANLVKNSQGIPVCLMYSFMDITEQKELLEQMRIKDVAIEKSITGIILTDIKGIITFVNDATAAIWGYEKSEFLGKYAAKFARSWAEIVDILNIVYEKGFWRGEMGGVRKDGDDIIVHLSASLIRDASKDPLCIMCSFVDVTRQKKMQEQMHIKDIALSSSINGMAITDMDGEIIYVNEAFYKMWGGVFPEEVIGHPIQNFAGSGNIAREINKAILRSGNWFGELMVKRRDTSTFDVQLSVNTISDSDMAPVHILYAFVDISEQKKAERELKKSHEQLEMRVMERTEALQNLNRQNIKEIEERKQAEKLLLQKEKDLTEKSRELEEMNMALKVLLRQREKDKEHIEMDIFDNVEKNVFPYIKKLLNRRRIGSIEREYILTIESHIREIVSPFLRKLQTTYMQLTPTEVMVANLIREAKTNKEIAALLNSSIQAVEFHRKNIRQKLNLKHSKINLRTYLVSLT